MRDANYNLFYRLKLKQRAACSLNIQGMTLVPGTSIPVSRNDNSTAAQGVKSGDIPTKKSLII